MSRQSFSKIGGGNTYNPISRRDSIMPYFTHPIAAPAPFGRSVAIAALLGATMLATPLTVAWAQNAPVTTAIEKTVQQRITELHASLKITPAEETQWNEVAQAMHENGAAMDKLVANRTTQQPNLSAVQDLESDQELAQADVDGLQNLIAAFSKLYDVMSDAQKKVADQVFQTSGTLAGSVPTTVAKHHGYRHNWNSGYYPTAPVVYGSPYNNGYYGSPYYVPGISIRLPFVNIGIQ
jgi:protein CpxP